MQYVPCLGKRKMSAKDRILNQANVNKCCLCKNLNRPFPGRVFEMTWCAFWQEIKARDGKVPSPVTDEEIRQRVLNAVSELFWEVVFIDNGGIKLNDGEVEYSFRQYDFRENAWLVISTLRREICYIAHESPDVLDEWSDAGINSLTEW